jgi:hypothetical protein
MPRFHDLVRAYKADHGGNSPRSIVLGSETWAELLKVEPICNAIVAFHGIQSVCIDGVRLRGSKALAADAMIVEEDPTNVVPFRRPAKF